MKNLHHNVLATVDIETTGSEEQQHDIVQLAVVPLNADLSVSANTFSSYIEPLRFDNWEQPAMDTHGITEGDWAGQTKELVVDQLFSWFQTLNLGQDRRIIPICQNANFEIRYLRAFLGAEYNSIFHYLYRDTLAMANMLNDLAAFHGERQPFEQVGLRHLLDFFGIEIENHHNAYDDCIAEAELYRQLIQFTVPLTERFKSNAGV